MLVALIFCLFAEIFSLFNLRELLILKTGTQQQKTETILKIIPYTFTQLIYWIIIVCLLFHPLPISLIALGLVIISFISPMIKTTSWNKFVILKIIDFIICAGLIITGIILIN